MNEDKLIEKARTFAKNGELQRAKDILEELDSPRARALLGKVNQAISAKKSEAVAQRSQAPEIAPKAALPDYKQMAKGNIVPHDYSRQKTGIDFSGTLGTLLIFIVAAGLGLFIARILDNPHAADWASPVYGWGIFILAFVIGVALQRKNRP